MKACCQNEIDSEVSTWIVIGLARGGTSLVAGVLRELGLYAGDACVLPHHEDKRLGAALKADDLEKIRACIHQYNIAGTWFFKDPASNRRILRQYLSEFRQPVFLFVRKKPTEIARRLVQLERNNWPMAWLQVVSRYWQLRRWLRQSKCPVLDVHYDDIQAEPSVFVEQLAKYAGITDRARIQAAKTFIRAGKQQYQYWFEQVTSPVNGFLDERHLNGAKGWAFLKEDAGVVNVVARLDDKVLAEGKADLFRPDVQAAGIGSDGYCGFELSWLKGTVASEDLSKVSVWVEGYRLPLSSE